jgi:hypothetical protein
MNFWMNVSIVTGFVIGALPFAIRKQVPGRVPKGLFFGTFGSFLLFTVSPVLAPLRAAWSNVWCVEGREIDFEPPESRTST